MRRSAAILALIAGLVAACGDDDAGTAETTTTSTSAATTTTTTPADDAAWAELDAELSALGTHVGFLAARVTDDGTCEAIHEVEPDTPRPIGSQFKLFVLGAVAEEIAAGRLSWDQVVPIEDHHRSLGNTPETGALQYAEPGASVALEEAATKMIEISDNTAADLLLDLVGRDAVEDQVAEWTDHADANRPFLTTRQMFLLHYAAGLADRYLATPQEERAAFLESEVDTLGLGEIASGFSLDPRYVHEIEWFASPNDLCRTFAGLQQLEQDPALSSRLSNVLSRQVAGIDLPPEEWSTVWYKGGSEPGVLTLGWLATTTDGETYVVEAMVSNPDAALADDSITDLRDLARDAFALLEP